MSDECVIAVYHTLADASKAVQTLTESGFPNDRVSVASKTFSTEEKVRKAIEYEDEMQADAVIGAGAGVVIGLVSAATVSTITGVGVLFMAGPIVAAGLVGGLLGAAAGWGVHKDHLKEYEEKLKQGKVLVIAHGDPLIVARAGRILQESRPMSLRLYVENGDEPFQSART